VKTTSMSWASRKRIRLCMVSELFLQRALFDNGLFILKSGNLVENLWILKRNSE
jgi:hypothetical protein